MRKSLCLALVLSGAASLAYAQPSVGERIAAYFRGWYAHIPGSDVSIKRATDIVLPGLEPYLVERHSNSKSHQESNLALYEAASGEIFVGDVLADPARAKAANPFNPGRDLANVEASLRDVFGLPVKAEIAGAARGALLPVKLSILLQKEPETAFTRSGYVSRDGSALMLGEFQPLGETPQAFREKLLAQSAGVRSGKGSFLVTEFLDFQCDRCRLRTPEVRRAVEEKGGAVELRFLPLVKIHDWAFAAAESAVALAAVTPELYRRYEETIFARAEGMSSAAARELASDMAEAAGVRDAFAAEISSGRARGRIARDVGLAMRLGIMTTPSFLYRGTVIPGEKEALETYLRESLPAAARSQPARKK